MTTNTHGFTLYDNGAKVWAYDLPGYHDRTGRAKQIALTPLTVVADLTIIGGFIFVYAWSQGAFNGTW